MSKLTVSPPRRLSKLSEVSTPLWWKKYSLPSSAAMNPNPRSETIFFTVPFGIAVLLLSNTEWNASALFEREECRPHARSPEGRATAPYFITTLRYTASVASPPSVTGARNPSAAIGRELQAEANQGQAGDGFEGPPNPVPAQKITHPGHHHGIEGEPAHRDRAEDQPQQQQALERGLAAVDELRQQAEEEDDDLRVTEVAEQSLPVGDAPTQARRTGGGELAKMTLREQRRAQRLEAEKDEVGGARQADGEEQRLRGHQQRRKPGAAGDGPGREPGDDAGRGRDAAAASSNQCVADGER